MAGLLVAFGPKPDWARSTMRCLAPALVHYPWLRTRTFETDRFALALVLHRDVEPPVWQTAGTSQVVIFGEYMHEDGHLVADRLVADVAADRWSQVRNGNGLYNLVVWDETRCRLVLANDATGALLLFRGRYREGSIWCSEPGALPLAGQFDLEGLRSLINIGYQADGRTLDDEITAMPPATTEVVQLVDGQLRHERHTGLPELAPGRVPFEAAYGDLLRVAVAARLPAAGTLDLPLTGGLDSRLLLAETVAAGAAARTFTVAVGDPRDVQLARRVASVVGVEHQVLKPEPGSVSRHRSLLHGALHTTSDWHSAQQLAICGAAAPGQPLLLGFLGGTLAGAFVDPHGAATGLRRMRSGALAPYRGASGDQSLAWSEAPGGSPAPKVAELIENLYGRQRRYISYLVRLAWNFGRPICPFADVRLLLSALAATRAELTGQRVRGRTLRHIDPRLAGIATTNDAKDVGPAGPRLLRNAIRRTGVMRPIRAAVPMRWGYDYERLRPLAVECAGLVPAENWRSAPADLPPMAVLALAPLLLEDQGRLSSGAPELIDSLWGR